MRWKEVSGCFRKSAERRRGMSYAVTGIAHSVRERAGAHNPACAGAIMRFNPVFGSRNYGKVVRLHEKGLPPNGGMTSPGRVNWRACGGRRGRRGFTVMTGRVTCHFQRDRHHPPEREVCRDHRRFVEDGTAGHRGPGADDPADRHSAHDGRVRGRLRVAVESVSRRVRPAPPRLPGARPPVSGLRPPAQAPVLAPGPWPLASPRPPGDRQLPRVTKELDHQRAPLA